MTEFKMNFNDYVVVHLTDYGATHLNKLRKQFDLDYGTDFHKEDYVEGQEYKARMWCLFRDFGDSICMGYDIPFSWNKMTVITYVDQEEFKDES